MVRTFYHWTTAEGWDRIPADGFRAGDRGGVWLSEVPGWCGAEGDRLLVVRMEVSAEEMAAHRHAVCDEVWVGPGDDDFAPAPEGEAERFDWYEFPPELVNARATVEQVSREAASKLLDGHD
jgi:hypothetical protein